MSPTIEVDEKVKKKLELFKEREGIKTFSDAIYILLAKADFYDQITGEGAYSFGNEKTKKNK